MPQFLWYTIPMKKHKIILCFLAIFFLILGTCENGLEDYLDLQRTMIPVSNYKELQAAIEKDGAVIGLVRSFNIAENPLRIDLGQTITVFAWDQDITLGLEDGSADDEPLFDVIYGTLNLGHSRSNGTLVLEGKSGRHEALVRINAPAFFSASCTMNNGVIIKNNENTWYLGDGGKGGGVHVSTGIATVTGTFIMNGGEISGNTADTGGGVFIDGGGTFIMKGGKISGNTATVGNGGGVNVLSGTFSKTGGTIYGSDAGPPNWNRASGLGAAVRDASVPYTRNSTAGPGVAF